jgi:predicted nucleic acid-binding protein
MVLCDTNIIIEVYRQNQFIRSVVESIGQANIAISDVTRAELIDKAQNKRELHLIEKYADTFFCLPVEEEISSMSINLILKYGLKHKLEFNDALIAATAIHHNIELYTLNVKDFFFIPGIRLYHPLS